MADKGKKKAKKTVAGRRREARKLMIEACEEFIDQWDVTTGSIVTGFVVVIESVRPDGSQDCLWSTGTGAEPVPGREEGLMPWRVEGLVRKVLHDITDQNVVTS